VLVLVLLVLMLLLMLGEGGVVIHTGRRGSRLRRRWRHEVGVVAARPGRGARRGGGGGGADRR
jgi:hypothetical protein